MNKLTNKQKRDIVVQCRANQEEAEYIKSAKEIYGVQIRELIALGIEYLQHTSTLKNI